MYSPQVVCFCDIPVEDLHIHTAKYGSFGLSFTKEFIARRGGAPVLYVPRGTRISQMQDLNAGALMQKLKAGGPEALFEDVPLGDLFDRMVPEFHSMMDLFLRLIMDARTTSGGPADHRRLHDLLMFIDFRIFSYVKVFDEARDDEDPENFYMEREWRVVGNVQFTLADVQRLIIPSSYGERLRGAVPDFCGQVSFVD
jgi:hypothetical protein